jgi:hypothetical protein
MNVFFSTECHGCPMASLFPAFVDAGKVCLEDDGMNGELSGARSTPMDIAK